MPPYLADNIYNEMIALYGKDEAETGGYQIYSTVSSDLQATAQQAVRRNLHDYDERHGYHGVVKQLWSVDLVKDKDELLSEQTISELNNSEPWPEEQMLSYLQELQPSNQCIPLSLLK